MLWETFMLGHIRSRAPDGPNHAIKTTAPRVDMRREAHETLTPLVTHDLSPSAIFERVRLRFLP